MALGPWVPYGPPPLSPWAPEGSPPLGPWVPHWSWYWYGALDKDEGIAVGAAVGRRVFIHVRSWGGIFESGQRKAHKQAIVGPDSNAHFSVKFELRMEGQC